MGLLLVVLVGVCAVASGAHVTRSLWGRARSVQRHQQALDTLADITQGADGHNSAPVQEGRAPVLDHQAHVRVIGRSGTAVPARPAGTVESAGTGGAEGAAGAPAQGTELPPPRPFTRQGQTGASPLRRPSRSAPSAASIDAVTSSATLAGAEGARLVRTGAARRAHVGAGTGIAPGTGLGAIAAAGPGAPAGSRALAGATTPLPVVPPPPPGEEPPTRPVTAISPHVFYFDDQSARSPAQEPGLQGDAQAAPGSPAGQPSTATGAPTSTLTSSAAGTPAGTAAAPLVLRRRVNALRWLEAAAVIAAFASAGTALVLVLAPAHGRSGVGAPVPTTAHARAVTTSPPRDQAAPSTTAPASAPATTTPAPTPTTAARAAPALPAYLVSTSSGTADYQLSNPSASIVVEASGPCWIEVRVGNSAGRVVYVGTLEEGNISRVTGPAWIRLGDPVYARVTVNGDHMAIPDAKKAVPLDLQFTVGE